MEADKNATKEKEEVKVAGPAVILDAEPVKMEEAKTQKKPKEPRKKKKKELKKEPEAAKVSGDVVVQEETKKEPEPPPIDPKVYNPDNKEYYEENYNNMP